MAQNPTNFSATFNSGPSQNAERFQATHLGWAPIASLGRALIALNFEQNLGQYSPSMVPLNAGTGPITVGMTLIFDRLNTITFEFQRIENGDNFQTATVEGRITGGTGAYAGASTTGGMSLTVARAPVAPLRRFNLSMTGSATIGGQTVNLAITDRQVFRTSTAVSVADLHRGTCSMPPLGSGTLTSTAIPFPLFWDENVQAVELNFNCAFSASDSLQAYSRVAVSVVGGQPALVAGPLAITGGTGRFAGASGSAQTPAFELLPGDTFRLTTSGAVATPSSTTPVITSVNTAYLDPSQGVAQNTWIEIKGANLVPANAPAGGMFWSNAPEFAQGRMPTELGGVSVTVNGRPAYVWWFCSKATTPSCATDQINVLTPLDDFVGQTLVEVKNGAASSGSFLVKMGPQKPSMLLMSARGDTVATHADGSLVGPATLFPGASTPARRGETISVWAVGFGLPDQPLVAGSSTQQGTVRRPLDCYVNNPVPVQAAAALVSPGLYQINVTIPESAETGKNFLYCSITGRAAFDGTPGSLIEVQ
jgi:uncharacterized protein (TIGR03437 family)